MLFIFLKQPSDGGGVILLWLCCHVTNFHPLISKDLPSKAEDVVETAAALVLPLLRELHCVVVTLGQHGVLVCGQNMDGSVSLHPGSCCKVEQDQTSSYEVGKGLESGRKFDCRRRGERVIEWKILPLVTCL